MEHLLHVRDMLNIHRLSHLSPLQQSYMKYYYSLHFILLVRKLREVIHWWSQNSKRQNQN